VLLDSNHARSHVLAEMEAYCGLVSPGSYIVAADGVMRDLYFVPRGKPEWRDDNPANAVKQFLARHPNFVLEPPKRVFRETELSEDVTYWSDGWVKRIA
jgi:cephalosporin hydroxylase